MLRSLTGRVLQLEYLALPGVAWLGLDVFVADIDRPVVVFFLVDQHGVALDVVLLVFVGERSFEVDVHSGRSEVLLANSGKQLGLGPTHLGGNVHELVHAGLSQRHFFDAPDLLLAWTRVVGLFVEAHSLSASHHHGDVVGVVVSGQRLLALDPLAEHGDREIVLHDPVDSSGVLA